MNKDESRNFLSISYVAIMFYAFHYFSLYYILATYLNKYFSESTMSILFAIASFFCIIISNYLNRFFKKMTNAKMLIRCLIIQLIITTLLAFSSYLSYFVIVVAFIIQYVLFNIIYISLSIFIEMFSKNEHTGGIRGTVLTILNLGAILAPFFSSLIFNLIGFSGLFIISALSILPIYYLIKKYYTKIEEPEYGNISMLKSINVIGWNKNLRGVLVSSFVLNSFYAIVTIYLAIYLVNILNIPMFMYLELLVPISIIPFIIVPYNLGKYSDRIFGEKRPMIFGIIIFSLVLISVYLFRITTNNILIWIILIFIARLGATINETSNYTYFYKSISSKNVGLIALFQNISNISFVIITGIGAILIKLLNIDIKLLFLIVGIMGLLSLFIIVKIKDKKNGETEKIETKNDTRSEILSKNFTKKEEVKIWS